MEHQMIKSLITPHFWSPSLGDIFAAFRTYMFLLLTVEHVITSSDEAKELLFQHVCRFPSFSHLY